MIDNDIYKNFGKRLKNLRVSKGITQVQMSHDLNISQTAVVQYEAGSRKIPLTMLKKFANYFSLSLDELVDPKETSFLDQRDVNTGNMIKYLRETNNLSRLELSKELDIDISSLASFESGVSKVPIDMLIKFANYFSVSVDSLVGVHIQNEDNPKLERIIIANDPHLRRSYEKWTKEVNESYFSDEELDKLIDYAKYLISQRKKE